MRNASPTLQAFMYSKQGSVFADLYTFILAGGTVKRYTSAAVPIVYGGYTFETGPTIKDSGVKQKLGLQVDSVAVDIAADDFQTINGVPLITFLRRNGLDGALVNIERALAANWDDMMRLGPVGAYIRYMGRVADVNVKGPAATINVTSWLELLDVDMPADVYQASCGNTLFDARCGVNRASWAASGAITGTSTLTTLATGISAASGTYDLGSIVFTSGANVGLRRTIKTQVDGVLQLIAPLLEAPDNGDTFTVYPGCDLRKGTCSGKFNNLPRFRGQPFIPTPETAV